MTSAHRSPRAPYLLVAPALIALIVGFVLPAWSLFDLSLGAGTAGGRSLDAYREAFEQEHYREAFVTTLVLSLAAAALCLAAAYPVAFYITFRAKRRTVLLFLLVLSTFVSYITRVYAWRIILGDTGIINSGLERLGLIDDPLRFLIFSRTAVMITWLSIFLPVSVLILTASMANVQPELLENARDLGAGPVRTFTRVLLPLTRYGAVGAFSFVLILAAGDFVTPLQVGGNIVFIGSFISLEFLNFGGSQAVAAALGFILLATLGAVSGGLALLVHPRRR